MCCIWDIPVGGLNTRCDMDLSGYLEIFCMWYASCTDNRMCCAVGFCLVD